MSIGAQHVEVGGESGLVIDVHQMQRLPRSRQSFVLRAQLGRIVLECPQCIRRLSEGSEDHLAVQCRGLTVLFERRLAAGWVGELLMRNYLCAGRGAAGAAALVQVLAAVDR
jgi:hypothetical protein